MVENIHSPVTQTGLTDGRKKWLALFILCLGDLMIVLDTTIVNVALPSIQKDLAFTAASLAWVVNAYLLTFGGFLLLGGRLGDLFGARKLFLIGLVSFTLASLACGFADSQAFLIVARAIQGLGGAIVTAVALSIVMNLFVEEKERAKAMGVFGFVGAGGGAIGVLLGGVLTNNLDWHWIFLVNIPIGILVFFLCLFLIPKDMASAEKGRLDFAGALTITAALMAAVYAIVNGNEVGWLSPQTLGLLAVALVLLIVFLILEKKIKFPLMPLSLFKLRNVATANVAGTFWAAGMFAWFFISALYLQQVLHYTPLQVGLAFLPANILMAILSLGLSDKIVLRFGIRSSLTVGLLFVTLGLLWLSRVPVEGQFVMDVLPSMLVLGFGCGISFNPMFLAAMSDVKPEDSGLASGVVNTAFMMGGALGLAILASIAGSRTSHLLSSGIDQITALNGGYQLAFLVGAIFAGLATMIVGIFLKPKNMPQNAVVH